MHGRASDRALLRALTHGRAPLLYGRAYDSSGSSFLFSVLFDFFFSFFFFAFFFSSSLFLPFAFFLFLLSSKAWVASQEALVLGL